MLKALSCGATGLNAQQLKVETVTNNLANISTTGFKKSRVEFSELVNQEVEKYGIPVAGREATEGSGVRVAQVARIFSPGNIVVTDRPLDLAIEGDGFLKVQMTSGEGGYTRGGSFNLDLEGNIVTSSGHRLEGIKLPPGSEKIAVTPTGQVNVEKEGKWSEVGQLTLYKYTNPEDLTAAGENIFLSQPAVVGGPSQGKPGDPGFGTVKQSSLEMANVDLLDEMTNLLEAQRAYSLNARTLRTADEMWGMANNLRK